MRFSALDAWRGVCALMVALLHLAVFSHFYSVPLVRHSYLFVDFFFVLSGFVMAHAYADRLERWQSVGYMMVRRFGRLWPLHATMLVACVLGEVARASLIYTLHILPGGATEFSPVFPLSTIPTDLLLMNSWGIYSTLTWNGPSWSIGAEFYTYLVFGILCVVARQRMIAVSAVVAAFGALIIILFSPNYMAATYDFGFFRCLYGFFVGQLTYAIYDRSRGAILPAATLCEAANVLGIIAFVSIANYNSFSYLAPCFFAVTVYVFAFQQGAVSGLLALRPFERLGTWSYSIYMVHALIADTLDRAFRQIEKLRGYTYHNQSGLLDFGGPFVMDAFAIAYLGIVVGLASLTYRFIEAPGRGFFNSLGVRSSGDATALAPHELTSTARNRAE